MGCTNIEIGTKENEKIILKKMFEDKLSQIKSVYILKNVFTYIKDINFPDKIFLYSKVFQKKLNLKIIKEVYFKKIGFNIDKYLYTKNVFFYKEYLTDEYNKFFEENKINKEKIENYIYEIYEYANFGEEDINKINENYEKKIDIYSPLFKIISKTKNFEKIFTIIINQKNIDEFELLNDYRNFFDYLNKLNIKYSSIYCIFHKFYDLKEYLENINIDMNKIKRLSLIQEGEKKLSDNNKNHKFTDFNNLIYLNINYSNYKYEYEYMFTGQNENLNDLKTLRYLFLQNVRLDKYNKFIIKIGSLKLLSINSCENIFISEQDNPKIGESNINELKKLVLFKNNNFNIMHLQNVKYEYLEILNLNNNKISDIRILKELNFKNLKILNLNNNEISDIDILEKVNFIELKELDLRNNIISDINILENANFIELEKLYLSNNKISDINILEKINFKELKDLYLSFNNISDIKVLDKAKFEKLEILNLRYNEISKSENELIISKLNSKITEFWI